MGLLDYFKRRRERESAIPESSMASSDASSMSVSTPSMSSPPPGPPAVSQGDLTQQMMGLRQLMTDHEVNLTQKPMEVRQAVASDLQARGINAQVGGALHVTDPEQIRAVIEVLKNHGLLPPNVTVD